MPKDRALSIAGALERRSDHPVARAVTQFVDEAAEAGQKESVAEMVEEQGGNGISGMVDGARYQLARVGYFAERGNLTGRAERVAEKMQGAGHSVALLYSEDRPLAAFGLADTVRADSAASLQRLKIQGIESSIILSGDTPNVVRSVATEVGADEWHAALLPAVKLDKVRELSQRYGVVAMVGDGINDAPALAQAEIGIAMGAAGSDAALEVADVALMGDNLSKIPSAINLARRARSVIVQNIFLALAMKLIFVVGLFFNAWGGYSLVGGVIADVGATLLVTANGLRLLRAMK
jgi:Cd2+/Zn2+-exporting ATPase